MALTERQKETVMSNLRDKIKGPCPMCGGTNHGLQDQVVGTMAASVEGGLGIGGPYIPMVQVVCDNCGFVAHYAIAKLGIKLD